MATKKATLQYIEPIGGRVLVLKDEPKRETKGGIALPEAAEIPTITGRIVTISQQVAHDEDVPLRQYDKILFHPKNAIPVDFEPDNQLFVVPVEDIVAVFRNDKDEVFALLDRCPHKGGPLSQGIVFGTHVACPLHNWQIGLCDGQASAPDEGCTPKFSVKVEDGMVFLSASELQAHATGETRPIAGPARRTATA